ncbi:aromatic/alkene monooxygenase hydroxylase subunit beta [Thermoflavimicrobium dichotomicum]|uniref:propane 2-monooxygenase n=1 Tax=Thermoflavimicrobium dichotomicum TaxID=46223 RepID=A0A1I3MZB3_9BACL|nr:aromatic/alkene monooxygenase hydroxylase subunit beta [Thermoflavimicrobium dichotomicum]SFJ02272.1 toluene monooxygenase system protein E [Thermoflavimicrobium dichotomicum]
MAQVPQRRRAKAWSLWEGRRIPSEYEVISHKLHYHFRRDPAPFELDPNTPLNQWYKKYREGSPFQVDDWEQFRDPDSVTYRDYIQLQKEREVYLDNLIDEFERQDHYAKLSKPWVDLLEQLYIPSRFSGHILQMVALYMAQMAPASYITNAAYFQGSDEMRRVQRSAYLAKVLSLDHGEHLADSQRTRAIWEDDSHWQPLRELLEKLLIAYDWGESFAALNLVVKPVYDALFIRQIAELARSNGDTLLALMHDDFGLDSQRSQRWTTALVKYAVERQPEHRTLLKDWVEKWTPLAYRAVEGLAPLFAKAPQPMQSGKVVEAVCDTHKAFLVEVGLE